jgi:Xaa-Pro aminopeptidase
MSKKIAPSQTHLITNKYNIRYLTNFTGTNGIVLLTQKRTFFLTDPRYVRTAKKVIPANIELIVASKLLKELNNLIKNLRIKNLLFEANNITIERYKNLKKALPKIKLKPQTGFIEKIRIIKTAQEIKLIKKSQQINEKTFCKAIKLLKPGKTEKQIAWEIQKVAHELKADDLAFPPIVAFGSNSGSPHHQNTNKKFQKGDIVLIDMGMKYKGYCSDMTRTLFTKTPTPIQQQIYQTVLEAQKSAIKEVKAGMTGAQTDAIARKIIKKAGFEKNFTHSLGHGVGLEVHEAPNISKENKKPIPVNSIITIEPGIYLEKSFGIRIEDMVLVKGKKSAGCPDSTEVTTRSEASRRENLTKIPKNIEEMILK